MPSFAVVIAFRPEGAMCGMSMLGKVGPFDTQEETDQWCRLFRATASKQAVDMTALPDFVLDQLASGFPASGVLPSRDPDEIINHAVVSTLLGFKV